MIQPYRAPRVPGAKRFTWAYWNAMHDDFERSDWPSRERWQLAHLHSQDTLEEIAEIIFCAYAAASKKVSVSVQSVWIDGTPQISGYLPKNVKLIGGELADLLFIVNEITPSGKVVYRTGLLIQGKTGKRHNKLPSNRSTKRERLLLESLDRSRPLEVFRDIGFVGKIGEYTFGTGIGLKDCARYLMMAKEKIWDCPLCNKLAPLQFGWPKTQQDSILNPTFSFQDFFQHIAVHGSWGKEIFEKNKSLTCEWSKLVWDLLGDYQGIQMKGYGRQNRMNVSPVISFATTGLMTFDLAMYGLNSAYPQTPPKPPLSDFPNFPESFKNPPAISIIQVDVRIPYGD